MSQPFPNQYKEVADGMGVSLYQKFSLEEASLFLSCNQNQLKKWAEIGDIECIKLPVGDVQFFGYQLIRYLLDHSTQIARPINSHQVDRMLRSKEVEKMTGLSRSTLRRYEKKKQFPSRVFLGKSTVGWKLSEIQQWIESR